MTEHASDPTIPRGLLISAGALVLASLIAVTAARLNGVGAVQVPDAAAMTTRELLFQDREDGSIAILDARTGKQVDSAAPGSNGFLRGTMRGLARERKRQGVSADVPFQLVGRADGRLTLIDPSTKRRVDLESFGPTNAAVFSKLMTQ